MNKITIVMYHFVRELQYTRYPKIKGLLVSEFKEQLKYFKKFYNFVTVEDCINAVYSKNHDIPTNSILLTFDDAYTDHFTNVFPILNDLKIQGVFFPPAKAILQNSLLNVNKIHFILASVNNLEVLLKDVFSLLDAFRKNYSLESNKYYYEKYAQSFRYDPEEIIFIKRLLQTGLSEPLRTIVTDELFRKYVSIDQESFSRELYLNLEQIQCMAKNGMFIGSHGYDHLWLQSISDEQQETEIQKSIEFLKILNTPPDKYVFCYPFGSFNNSLIEKLKNNNFKLGFTTNPDIANLTDENAFTLSRLDTNDFPKTPCNLQNEWTKKTSEISLC